MSMRVNPLLVPRVNEDGVVIGLRTVTPEGEGRTKQEFKEECDVNHILRNYATRGAEAHFAKYGARYGDYVGPQEYHIAIEVAREAQEMFMDLPAKVRKKFSNDPAEFLAFVQDEKNAEEMLELGLREKPPRPDFVRIDPESVSAIAAAMAPGEGAEGAGGTGSS